MYSQYLSDAKIQSFIGDEAFVKQMIRVEIALAKVQAKQGLIPKWAAKEIAEKLKDFSPSPGALAVGTLQNGIPTIPLLALARKELTEASQDYLHWGATSQDIMDTATVLMIKEVLVVFEKRLLKIIKTLKALAEKQAQTFMVARTRTQQAISISFGLKVNNWLQPLERHLERLNEMKPRLLVVQFGGAAGNLAALGNQGWETAQRLAKALNLHFAGVWHTQRDNMAAFSNWLALLAGSFGKMAQDILLLSQTEVGEVLENGGGGGKSSTMPHKNNPVLSEAIVALSRFTGQLAGNNLQAMIHNHERDASAWILEWLALPQMINATGTILNHALTISENIQVNKKAMQANWEKQNGLIFSEQATFILQAHISRKKAKAKVETACQMVLEQDIHLTTALTHLFPELSINWQEKLQAKNYQGSTKDILKKKQ
ncbi:MAG: adenylosuccinate lyase family protein [Saprospiraceae bacterium]